MALGFVPAPIAGATSARPIWHDVRVLVIEWMAKLAVCLGAVAEVWPSGSRLRLFLGARDAPACAAQTGTGRSDACVLRRVLMAVVAVGAGGVVRGLVVTAQNVDPDGHQLKMLWVHAKGVSAKMVKRVPDWQAMEPAGFKPTPHMRADLLPLAGKLELAVPSAVTSLATSRPKPAFAGTFFLNLLPESVVWMFDFVHEMTSSIWRIKPQGGCHFRAV
jgi:hypothetical protein